MKKLVRILIKSISVLILFALVISGFLYLTYNKPLPQGTSGTIADGLANTMLKRINHKAYLETRYIEWDFRNQTYHYKWDRQLGIVRVGWKEYRVLLNLDHPEKSSVFDRDKQLKDKARLDLIETAVVHFNNDSFWLVAPFKVFDKGTVRKLVTLEDGSNELLVTYTTGGTTPGDSYLWKIGDTGLPESFRMWVNIIPIGGLEATWKTWKVMDSGVFLPTSHQLGPINFAMENVKAYN